MVVLHAFSWVCNVHVCAYIKWIKVIRVILKFYIFCGLRIIAQVLFGKCTVPLVRWMVKTCKCNSQTVLNIESTGPVRGQLIHGSVHSMSHTCFFPLLVLYFILFLLGHFWSNMSLCSLEQSSWYCYFFILLEHISHCICMFLLETLISIWM